MTDSLITAAVARRFAETHPNAQTKMTRDAQYVSAHLKEYIIYHDGSLWRIKSYQGGALAPEINGGWMSRVRCEEALCVYLKKNDKFKKAIYPGSPYVKSTNL